MGGHRLPAIAAAVAALIVALVAGAATAASNDSRAELAPQPSAAERTGRLIVQLDTPLALKDRPARVEERRVELAARRIDELAARIDAAFTRPVPELGAVVAQPRDGQTLAELRSELNDDPLVARVEPELRYFPRYIPNDPLYGAADPDAPGGDTYQWHLRRENFPLGWDASKGGNAQVGVIDTGIAGGHVDLSGRIVGTGDFDSTITHGPPTVDEDGHGTHVSGLACADSDNGFGIASSGFDCGLIVEKIDFTTSSIYNAMVHATNLGAEVLNLSLGSCSPSGTLNSGVSYAWGHDVVIVAAASNNQPVCGGDPTNQGYPARYVQPQGSSPDINAGMGLVVTAAEYDDTRADLSLSGPGAGYGTGVSMAAYGDSSVSTLGIYSTYPPNGFTHLFGTSQSTPQVAGAAALMRSANPGLTAAQTILILKQTARRSGGWTNELAWGILDASPALTVAANPSSLECKGHLATIVGTPGNDVRVGTPGRDVMLGLAGKDRLSGEDGKDLICGGRGRDTLRGGKAKDKLLGQKGRDKLKGGKGNDTCKGGKGNDSASACETEKSI